MWSKFKKSDQREDAPSAMPLMPLRDIVVFPNMVVPLFVGREKSIKALEHCMANDKLIILSAQRDAKKDSPRERDIYSVGTVSQVLQLLRLPDNTVKVLVEGKQRTRILNYLDHDEFFIVEYEEMEDIPGKILDEEALVRLVREAFDRYAKTSKKVSQDVQHTISAIEDPARLADAIMPHIPVSTNEKQKILESQKIIQRLERLLKVVTGEIEVIDTEHRIKGRVKKQMEKTQREYYLNEQMRAIQKEMGEKDDFKSELNELEKRIKRKKMPREVASKVRAEFKKLKFMSPMSAEATVVRNYIEWLLTVPWYERTKDKVEIEDAERILEEDHYGLEKPKERIIEYLAVQKLVKRIRGPVLCFVGPPGVGKTSLAKSVARSMARNFVRLSLGGVRDEAEIRGHRRTYIGALPGKIVQMMKRAKVKNPVMCLDEVDKLSSDFRGDPSAALLEVLDPEQNHAFNDHYIDVDYDLSEVLFICTANTLYSIPPALKDRMETINLPGYTEFDKYNIADQFLVKKQKEFNGLSDDNIEFSDESIYHIIRRYTKEAGVRNLEREIASICRKVARVVVKDGPEKRVVVKKDEVEKYLGVPKFRYGESEEKDEIGVATGLAYTEFGGELLGIEVVFVPGKGKLTVTGKLGDVMQESARAAFSYVRSRAEALGADPLFYKNVDLHIHVPEGAIPKDGPSAGITIATAITSALIRAPVRANVGMTGEITLRGRVLPIGGLKEKILAAQRGNIAKVIIPKDNTKDITEIPEQILKDVEIVPVGHVDEVLKIALAVDDPEAIFKCNECIPPEEIKVPANGEIEVEVDAEKGKTH